MHVKQKTRDPYNIKWLAYFVPLDNEQRQTQSRPERKESQLKAYMKSFQDSIVNPGGSKRASTESSTNVTEEDSN